jgi:adenylate kinase family enzyme
MQRILVMGSSRSGKSTFEQRLSAIMRIPFMPLDALYWRPGWVESDRAEFNGRVTEAALGPQWIVDGNHISHAGELRRQVCDTIIWFDLPRSTRMLGIMRRIAGSYGQVRPEMAEGCPEKIHFEFSRYVWTYRQQQRPKLLKYSEGSRAEQSLVCFTNPTQANRYLRELALVPDTASVH